MPATAPPAGSIAAKSSAGFARREHPRTNDEGTDAKVRRDEAHNDALERTAPGSGKQSLCAVAQDTRRARELYEAAAEHGEFLGSVFLARFLASGTSGPGDTEGALRWYRHALRQAPRVQECPELEEARAYVAANGSRDG